MAYVRGGGWCEAGIPWLQAGDQANKRQEFAWTSDKAGEER